MKQNIMKRWVNALRSGKYKQGTGALRQETKTTPKFCCLGVLCDLHRKEIGADYSWSDSTYCRKGRRLETGVLPRVVMKWAGLKDRDPSLVDHYALVQDRYTASDLNDNGKRFKTIAKLIVKAQKEKRI